MQSFRRLSVWRKAHALALNVRRAIRKFPRGEYGSTRSQMIRAAESIPFNIVEGCGASTPNEFARYLDISIKSSMELEYQLQLARDNGVLSAADWRALTAQTVEVRRMICGLRAKVRLAAAEDRSCRGPSVTEKTNPPTTDDSQRAVERPAEFDSATELHPQSESQR
jgi:four helix bundle protein